MLSHRRRNGIAWVGVPLTLVSCSSNADANDPRVYAGVADRWRASFPGLLGKPCDGVSERQCYRVDQPRRMRGLWQRGLEITSFIDRDELRPATAKEAEVLVACLDSAQAEDPNAPPVTSGAYDVEFIGRKTLYPGHYGHVGACRSEIFVDRFVSLRRIGDMSATPGWYDHWIERIAKGK
jgi:hypothetical protein